MPDEFDEPNHDRSDSEDASDAEMNDTDALLSALHDGELAPEVESALRERVLAEPALAERLASFERVDDALRALVTPEVPADLAARMRARIAEQAESASPIESRADPSDPSAATRRRPRPSTSAPPRRRAGAWSIAAGLATAAAALGFYFLLPAELAESPEGASPQTSLRLAETAEPEERVDPELQREAEPVSLLAMAGDEELGIALYYDELADLEVLEQFELLEILAAIEEAEHG